MKLNKRSALNILAQNQLKTQNKHTLLQVVGGTAELNGQLMRGDQIIHVNNQDLSNAKQDQAVAVLKTASGVVKIKVRRYKLAS